MKILYYSPHPYLFLDIASGPGAHMREMIQAFRDNGHEVFPLILGEDTRGSLWNGNPDDLKDRSLKARIKRLIPSIIWETFKDIRLMRFDRSAATKLEATIRKFQPDVVYERGYYLMKSGVTTCKKLGVKHILEMNAPYPEERIMMEGSSLFLKKASEVEMTQLLTTHQIVVVSSSLRDYVLSRIGAGKKTITVTPNAVNTMQITSTDDERQQIRHSLGIADSTIVIGFVGSIFPYHGVDKLIESFAEIEQTDPNVHLLVVGTGHALSDLKRQVRSLRLSGKVTFTGEMPHQEVGKYIHTMDITVMANSNWYGSPVKIFEYGAACKPIIAPDIEPLRDVIDNETDGLLVIPEHHELVKTMRRLVQMPDLRHQLGLRFQKKVFAHHTWKKMAARILMEEQQTQEGL